MRKILYCASGAGHLFRFHRPYLDALRADGYEVKTLARADDPAFPVDFEIPFEKKFFSPKNFAAVHKIRKILKAERFDAILVHTSLAACFVRLACKRKDRPRVVNVVHGYLFGEQERSMRKKVLLFAEKYLRKKTDAVIVMNEEDARIAERHSLAKEILSVPGFGVKTPTPVSKETALALRSSLGGDRFLLFFAGELSARKNEEFLIRSMKKILSFVPNARLVLAGDGGERGRLEALAESLLPEGAVLFLGKREDIPALLSACDLYVNAAKSEGLPFNLVETLLAGKPAVASDVKGNSDVLSDGAGFLYPAEDIGAFVSLVRRAAKEGLSPDPAAVSASLEKFGFDGAFPVTYSAMKEAAHL